MSDPGERDDEGPLARWSRRKALAKQAPTEASPEAAEDRPEFEPEPPEAPDERTETEILEELGLPAPESLQPGDDFSGFLRNAVPEAIRRRALRRLWLSNPVLANLDGLVDYGEDYTDAAVAVPAGMLKTAYKIGRGFLTDAELAGEREPPPMAEPAPMDAESQDAAMAEARTEAVAEEVAEDTTEDAGQGAEPVETEADAAGSAAERESAARVVETWEEPEPPVRGARRMSFRFDPG